ncbi:MAG: hypothetical protein WCJ10_08000, partial [Opitutaceae bacterium]
MSIRSAEKLEASGDFVGAAEKLESARKLIETVRRYHPEWKPEMVNGRSAKNTEAIAKIRPKADEQRRKDRNVVAELEGGVRNSGTVVDPAEAATPPAPSVLEADPLQARRLASAEAEVKRLRDQVKNTTAEAESQRHRDLAKNQAAEAEAQRLRELAKNNAAQLSESLRTRELAKNSATEAEAQRQRELTKNSAAQSNEASRNESRVHDL